MEKPRTGTVTTNCVVHDDNHDWEFLFRTLNINFNYWGADKPYIKLGHFELPFGAEYNKKKRMVYEN